MKALLAAAALLATCIPSQARIGETMEQCIARYGPVVEHMGKDASFKPDPFTIIAEFENGKCVTLYISSKEEITETQINVFLKANGGENTWIKDEAIGSLQWHTKYEKDRLRAIYKHNRLSITNWEYFKKQREIDKQEEADKMKKF